MSANRYLVVFNPVEQERLCLVTILVNSPRVRVLTEDGQSLAAQLSAQWSSPTEMSSDGYQVGVPVGPVSRGLCLGDGAASALGSCFPTSIWER